MSTLQKGPVRLHRHGRDGLQHLLWHPLLVQLYERAAAGPVRAHGRVKWLAGPGGQVLASCVPAGAAQSVSAALTAL